VKPSPGSAGRSARGLAVSAAALACALALWYVLTTLTGVIGPARFPAPAEVLAAFRQVAFDGYADGRLHEHVLHSAKLVLMGFAAAVSIGVPLGLAMGWSRRAEAFVNPIFLTIRPVPPLAWIPLAIVWLGLGDGAKILVIWFAAFVPAVINSYTGVRAIEPYLLEASRMLGVRGWTFVREVLLPAALPHIFTGLRLSLQASWTTLVAAELIGAALGLGHVLNASAQDIFPAMILVGMAFVGFAGGFMTWVLARLEARAAPWRAA
jgi:NitT/TauT family transport system permease protein/taurine transport system permease protein